MKFRNLVSVVGLLLAAGGCIPKKSAATGEQQAAAAPTDVSGLVAHNLLKNSTFEDGTSLPWMTSFSAPASGEAMVQNGAYCLRIDGAGTNPWDAQVRHREMVIQKGHSYTVSFKAWADKPTKVRPKVGQSGPPYSEYWSENLELSTAPQQFTGTFTMYEPDDGTAELAFHMGGGMVTGGTPLTVCIDDVILADPQFTPTPGQQEAPPPDVLVNQVGYLPGLQKLATVKDASTAPLTWEVLDAEGKPVASGQSSVFGQDAPSGDHVHVVDFSSLTQPGKGYTLKVGDKVSYPFDVGEDVYQQMKYDALWYFYHNRSGTPIAMPYAGEQQWARPAGHLSDSKVACAPNTGCSYTLDVSGGWYDAGDHGKYVVNGGISTWTLLNWHERTKHLGTSAADYADGKLRIPENKNGVPDLLDEARWNVEFLLKMQVPDGQPKAGMAHHKIHDESWTALGMAPHESKMTRYLRPPSTAATLNLAAVGAQCARIWKAIDAKFSARCLTAAEKAWQAAKANPNVLAPASDSQGGGPYDDKDVSDDFYWAAAELFTTTGKGEYKDFVLKSPSHAKIVTHTGEGANSMNWANTAALGKITLAVVPNQLGGDQVKLLRGQIQSAGDAYVKLIDENGYRVPMKGDAEGKYPWGSNSFVLNNLLVLGLSHDFGKDPKYLNAMQAGMSYLLGRNPLGQSYVTGYGERPLENPHHRFWSKQANSKYPEAPPGVISGGPNSSIQDPYAKAAGLKGCAPQKCFVDHIEAWSVNEITINWNAPFAWVTGYLDEKAAVKTPAVTGTKPGGQKAAKK